MASTREGATFRRPRGAVPARPTTETVAEADGRLCEALADFIPHVMRLNGTPGLNIALARRGEVVWAEGFGYADLDKGTPMTAATVTHSGSMAKLYTAVAVLQLVERGVLRLDAPIDDHLDFPVSNPLGARPITLEDLLTHQSGLNGDAAGCTYGVPPPLGQRLREALSRDTVPQYRGTWRKLWCGPVGGQFMYANLGIALAGYIVERTNPERLSFSDYVDRHIIRPLGMTSTQFPPVQAPPHARAEILERASAGYASLGQVSVPTPTIYFADYPAGTVLTIPADHIRLLLALQAEGGVILKPETVRTMMIPRAQATADFGAPRPAWGLGLMLAEQDTADFSFGHAGLHMFGWSNNFRAFPRLGFAYAIFTNHWSILPGWSTEVFQIEAFLKAWVKSEIGGVRVDRSRPPADWAWKTSYVLGAVFAEQLMGLIGIDDPPTPAAVESAARGAQLHLEAANVGSGWDPDGFRKGVADLTAIPMEVEQLRAALASGRLAVTADEFDAIGRQVGLSGSPMLLPLAEP